MDTAETIDEAAAQPAPPQASLEAQEADYERFVGRLAKIWLNEPVENKKYIEGRLAGYSEGIVKVALKNHEVSVPYDGILKANLVVEF